LNLVNLDCWDKHPVANIVVKLQFRPKYRCIPVAIIVVKPRIFGLLVQNSDVSDKKKEMRLREGASKITWEFYFGELVVVGGVIGR
jgi:hypothetical protein